MFEYTIQVLNDRLSELRNYREVMSNRISDEDTGSKILNFLEIEEKVQDILAALDVLNQFSRDFSDSEVPDEEKLILSDEEIEDICSFDREEEAYE